jgi:hypothetical protein
MPHNNLSKKKRLTYLALCVVAFLILAPLTAWYATGYRLSDTFKFTKTGGIYVVTEGKGFSVLLNNKEQEVSSLFRRSFFIQNLHPDVYSLKVTKPGYITWEKSVIVASEKVTEGYPFNLPATTTLIEIPKMIVVGSENNSTSSTSTLKNKEKLNDDYITAKALFATTSDKFITQKVSSSTLEEPEQILLSGKTALWAQDDEIFVEWKGEMDIIPSYFCTNEVCMRKVLVYKGEKVNAVDFFFEKNAFIMFALDSGLYVTEIDARGGRNTQKLLMGKGYDFRIDRNQVLFIKNGTNYYHLNVSL